MLGRNSSGRGGEDEGEEQEQEQEQEQGWRGLNLFRGWKVLNKLVEQLLHSPPHVQNSMLGSLNLMQLMKTGCLSTIYQSAVWYHRFSGLGSGIMGFERFSFHSIVKKSMGWVMVSG